MRVNNIAGFPAYFKPADGRNCCKYGAAESTENYQNLDVPGIVVVDSDPNCNSVDFAFFRKLGKMKHLHWDNYRIQVTLNATNNGTNNPSYMGVHVGGIAMAQLGLKLDFINISLNISCQFINGSVARWSMPSLFAEEITNAFGGFAYLIGLTNQLYFNNMNINATLID